MEIDIQAWLSGCLEKANQGWASVPLGGVILPVMMRTEAAKGNNGDEHQEGKCVAYSPDAAIADAPSQMVTTMSEHAYLTKDPFSIIMTSSAL